jgi:hypothetical protein
VVERLRCICRGHMHSALSGGFNCVTRRLKECRRVSRRSCDGLMGSVATIPFAINRKEAKTCETKRYDFD